MNLLPPALDPIGGVPGGTVESYLDTTNGLLQYIVDFLSYILDFTKGIFELLGQAVNAVFVLMSSIGNFISSFGIFEKFFPTFAWASIGGLLSFAVAFLIWKVIADTVG